MRRLGLLARFYTPAIRMVLIVSGVVLVLAYVLSFSGVTLARIYQGNGNFMLMYSMGVGIAGWVYLAGPFIFAMPKKRALVTTLPASWQEKSVFVFLWSFVVYPLYLAGVWYCMTGLCRLFSDAAFVNEVMMGIISENVGSVSFDGLIRNSHFYSAVNDMAAVSIIALVICSVRRNRMVLGIVGGVVGMFAFWLIGVIMGIYIVVTSDVFSDVVSGASSPDSLAQGFVDELTKVYPIESGLAVLVVIVCVVLTIRKIKMRQG